MGWAVATSGKGDKHHAEHDSGDQIHVATVQHDIANKESEVKNLIRRQ